MIEQAKSNQRMAINLYLAVSGLGLASTFVLGVDCGLGGMIVSAKAAEEGAAEIIAVQIRKQGYSCEKALSAERSRESSKPNEAVWTLKCDTATYRVRLVPDLAADVQRLE